MSEPRYPEQQQPRFVPNQAQGYPPQSLRGQRQSYRDQQPYGGQEPYGGQQYGGQQYGGQQYGGPPPEPPRKKRHWIRNTFLGFCAFIVLIIIIAVAANHGSSNAGPSVAASPDSTSAANKASSPQATHAAAPAAAAKPQTLLDLSGSGDENTARYTVGGSGNYDIYWSYNEGNMGSTVNFDFEGDGGSDFKVTGPNQLGTGGSGVTHVYGDSGQHYLQILSEGNWTIKVVTVP